MKQTILVTLGSSFAAEAVNILKPLGTVECIEKNDKELQSHLTRATILIVGIGMNIDQKIIDEAPRLKIIATATTGLDHIDTEYAGKKGISVVSLRGEEEFLKGITPTAELAFGLMISLLRHIVPASDSVKKGEWNRDAFRGHSISGLTLGIIGMGRLGTMMMRYGQVFGMRVLGCDPKENVDGTWENVSLHQLLQESDVVSLHVHLASDTENMIDAKALALMKPSAVLINTARGKLVHEKDLLKALKEGTIAGYATDVLSSELDAKGDVSKDPLVQYAKDHDNVLITPHIGGMTEEARKATDVCIAEKLVHQLS